MEQDIRIPRPLLTEHLARSTKEWGIAPKYNEEYRKIRWPNDAEGHKPMWLYNLTAQRTRKIQGSWNRTMAKSGIKKDTHNTLMRDIKGCMSQNIPFKTVSFEYVPSTCTLHMLETAKLEYDLFSGCLKSFTYGGSYDKRINYFLRAFNLDVKIRNRKLVWVNKFGVATEIDINQIYRLPICPIRDDKNSFSNSGADCEIISGPLYSEMMHYLKVADTLEKHDKIKSMSTEELVSNKKHPPSNNWFSTVPGVTINTTINPFIFIS